MGNDFISDQTIDMWDHKVEPSLLIECSAAARRNLRWGRHIYDRCMDNNGGGKLVMMDLHHIFNAAIILLLHQMVYLNVVNTDTIGILAAKRIFENEARMECASPGSIAAAGAAAGGLPATGYASDCLGVLNDLAELVAHIRFLRFRGSDHVNTGVNVGGFGVPVMDDLGGAAGGGGGDGMGGPHRAGSSSSAGLPLVPSEEELAANLGLENPYNSSKGWYDDDMMQEGELHTNQKEMERWVHECREGLIGPFIKYTGM